MSLTRRLMLLNEVLRLKAILLEDRVDHMRANLLPRLVTQIASGSLKIPAAMHTALGIGPMPHGRDAGKYPNEVAEKLFAHVLSVDPDPVKSNSQWLLTQIMRKPGGAKPPMPVEDLEAAHDTLVAFADAKKQHLLPKEQGDINRFASLSDLAATVREVTGTHAQQQVAVADADLARAKEWSKTIYDGPDYLVVSPKNEFAACYWGRPTAWCTAWGDHRALGLSEPGMFPTRTNMFDQYNRQGPLYVVIDKATGERWQFHEPSRQFMDKDDRRIRMEQFMASHPKVMQVFADLEGKPAATFEGYPVYRIAGGGLMIKSMPGLMGTPVLTLAPSPAHPGCINPGFNEARLGSHATLDNHLPELAALLNKLGIRGVEKTSELLQTLYYVNGKWGSIAEVGHPVLRFEDGHAWKAVAMDTGLEVALFDAEHREMLQVTLRSDHMADPSEKPANPASWSHYLTELLIRRDEVKQWTTDSYIKSYDLLDADAKRLVEAKPGFADIATSFKVFGASEQTKEAVNRWCNEYGITEHGWDGDRLIVRQFDDFAEAAEYLGDADFVSDAQAIHSGDGVDSWWDGSHIRADRSQIEDLVETLDKPTIRRLGLYLKKLYKDDVADEFDGDYDPASPADIARLVRAVRDDEVQGAADSALDDGERAGAEADMHKAIFKALDGCGHLFFASEKGSGWSSAAKFDTKAVYAVPLAAIATLVRDSKGEEEAAHLIDNEGWVDLLDDKIKNHRPYNGWSGYDDEAARERFADAVAEFLPEPVKKPRKAPPKAA